MSSPHQQRKSVSELCREIHARGWVANHDGNISVRLDQEARILISPTAVSKRLISASALVICDLNGKPIGPGKPPSEIALHLGAYRARADVKAVIHAHPPHASAFALARASLEPVGMPEVVVSLGARIPLVRLLLPKDPASADAVAEAMAVADVALLAGNGVIAVGADLEQAYLRVELLEHYARISSIARGLGGAAKLEAESEQRLEKMRREAGLGPPAAPAPASASAPAPKKSELRTTLMPIVAEEVRRALGGTK